jgi:hypothetical protein
MTGVTTAAALYDAHCARHFGDSGVRSVELCVVNGRTRAVRMLITHSWVRSTAVCRSTFVLTAPSGICGTTVLLTERSHTDPIQIRLRLRRSDRFVEVDEKRHQEFFLGTDFTYDDLRFWLPYRYFQGSRVCCHSRAERDATHAYDVLPPQGQSGVPSGLVLDQNYGMLRTVWPADACEARQIEARHVRVQENVAMPKSVVALRRGLGYASIMRLRSVVLNVCVPERMFEESELLRLSTDELRNTGQCLHALS